MQAPTINQVEFTEQDHETAKRLAERLGYKQHAYTSTSGLWGLFCLPENPAYVPEGPHCGGCIIKTEQFGLMFVQDLEDLKSEDLQG